MQRQLRNRGGVMTVKTIRKKYGLGSDFQDFKDKALGKVRDLIPNELADVAVKAAPFVAPFYPGYAAAMRGIGRFDQRGSISDALKQGAATYAFGKGVGKLGGAEGSELGNVFGRQKYSMEGFKEGPIGSLFKSDPTKIGSKVDEGLDVAPGVPGEETLGVAGLIKKGIKVLPKGVAAQLAAGTITAGASLLASYLQGDFREQEEGETMEDYLAVRKEAVGGQMRTYMDNYFKFDSEYSTMTDAQKDAFVARYNVRDGGRIGFANGGDIERFKKALYAANQVDEATGDRLYGNQINSLYAQYQNNPSGFFSEPEMYTRFNASFNAPATREEDEDLLSLTGDGLLNQAAIARSQQAKANEDALNMLNESMARTTQTPTTQTGSNNTSGIISRGDGGVEILPGHPIYTPGSYSSMDAFKRSAGLGEYAPTTQTTQTDPIMSGSFADYLRKQNIREVTPSSVNSGDTAIRYENVDDDGSEGSILDKEYIKILEDRYNTEKNQPLDAVPLNDPFAEASRTNFSTEPNNFNIDVSSANTTEPEKIMSEPLDAVPTNNPFQDTLGAPISEQRTPGINMSNTLRQNLLNNMEQRAANQRVLQDARARLPGAGIMNAPVDIMPPMSFSNE